MTHSFPTRRSSDLCDDQGSMAAVARLKKTISKTVKSIGPSGSPRRRYRTIWISDIHLGTRGCNDRLLIDFFDHVDSDTLYLVGDIIDGWRMRRRFYCPERHNAIVRRVMKRAHNGRSEERRVGKECVT